MHFTYSESPQKDALCQGDVLKTTDELLQVLSENHPYFANAKYKAFLVLTQTCDLVRRNNGECNSQYITLAALRSYDDFILRESNKYKIKEINGFKLLEKSRYDAFLQQLERLYNNNENGYFFLSDDSDAGIQDKLVAFLKVSFALKSNLHYDKCVKAKIAELNDEFKAKLGWLVGQMYSRVGTKDWYTLMERSSFLDKISDDLKSRFVVAEKERLNELSCIIEAEHLNYTDNAEDVKRKLDSIVIKSNYEKSIDAIETIINKKGKMDEDSKAELIRFIKSSSELKSAIK